MILPLHFGDAVEAELKCLLSSSALKSTSRAKTFYFLFQILPFILADRTKNVCRAPTLLTNTESEILSGFSQQRFNK